MRDTRAGPPFSSPQALPCHRTGDPKSRDFIILLAPGFIHPQKPGRRYFCPYGNQIEGALASNPGLASRITVKRISFLRPRAEVVAPLGPDNQGLPVPHPR
ncbi:DUF3088 family protein [Xanthobacter aminoxidans]|uniref:DUF3088 family protein n=1 Tax=Xanthobacter aminoxidans TaxID=186280 RepID=UPI0037298F0E